MRKNKYGVKIKHRRLSLYKKKKSGLRKTVEIILTIVLVGGLGLLGYSLGKPLLEYITNNDNSLVSTPEPWTPDVADTEYVTTTAAATSSAATEEPEPVELLSLNAQLLDNSALANIESFTQAVQKAKQDGYTGVAFVLKDEVGTVLYKSTLKTIAESTIVSGTLTTKQLADVCKAENMTSTAIVNTLRDRTAPTIINTAAYRWADDSYAWLDARAEDGGKQWLDPFRNDTISYISSLVKEINRGGIDNVVLSNTIFPAFTAYDKTILSAQFFNENRSAALANVVNSCSELGNTVFVEVDLADVLNYSGFVGTAEVLNRPLENVNLLLTFSKSSFSETLSTSETTSITLPTDISSLLRTLFGNLSQKSSSLQNLTIIPCIDSTGLSADEISQAISTLKSMNYENYLIK